MTRPLKALGMRRVVQMPDNTDGVGYGFDYPVFWIDRYHPHSVKQYTAFAAKSRSEVDAFHAAALKAGGTENGPPACAARVTTPRLCWIQMVTTSRPSSVATQANSKIKAAGVPS
jgi:hypothetical protein